MTHGDLEPDQIRSMFPLGSRVRTTQHAITLGISSRGPVGTVVDYSRLRGTSIRVLRDGFREPMNYSYTFWEVFPSP